MTSLSFIDPNGLPDISPRDRDIIGELVMRQLASQAGSDHLSFRQIQETVTSLPRLSEDEIVRLGHEDSVCPICFTSLLALLAEEETAIAMDSPAHPVEELGVTKLAQPWQCGHIFCRRDISRWIKDGRESCPTCRRPFQQTSSAETPRTEEATDDVRLVDPSDYLGVDILQEIRDRLSSQGGIGGEVSGEDFLASLGGSHAPSQYESSAYDSNRDDFAGMYS